MKALFTMTDVGNSYALATDAGSVDVGTFFLDLSGPSTLTVGNVDSDFFTAFPLSTTYTESIPGPAVAKLSVYYWDAELAATLWVDLTTEASPSAGVTSYNIIDFVVRTAQPWDPYIQFYILTEFSRTSGVTGATGPSGANGGQGPTGTAGPTGPVSTRGVGMIVANGSDQTFSTTTPQVVSLGTVGVASTNTSDVTLTGSNNSLTCVATGVYQVSAHVNWTATNLQVGVYLLSLRVNGTVRSSVASALGDGGLLSAVPGSNSQNINVLVSATAGDVLDLEVTAPSAVSVSLSGSGDLAARLSAVRVA